MAIGTTAAIVGAAALSAGAGVVASSSASKSSRRAADAQVQANDRAIAEQRRQFDETRALLQPYVEAGGPALQEQLAILGLLGDERQDASIAQQERSPFFQALAQQGEDALLQNASATGGVRGGNVQGALSQFRPNLLNSFINQQYERLGGIAGMGQNAAAGVGNFGANMAGNVSNLLVGSGQARAGGILAQGQAQQNMFNQFGQIAGTLGTFGAMGGFGGGGGGGFQLAPAAQANIATFLNNPMRF